MSDLRRRFYFKLALALSRPVGELAALSAATNPTNSGPQPGERPVAVHGTPLWPRADAGHGYAELCQAVWFWQFVQGQFPADWTVKARAMQTRQMLRWLPVPGAFKAALRAVCDAVEAHPGGTIDAPPPPVNHGRE